MLAGAALGGCAKPPAGQLELSSYQPIDRTITTASIAPQPLAQQQPVPARIHAGHLAGRTLAVGSTAEIILKPGEVVLTFDDGPRPGRTDAILDTLDQFGVKATFLMLGEPAEAHPETVRKVAAAGHTIGTHTFDHADLTKLSRQEALDEIAHGERAVAAALSGSGYAPAPFFRFPYLAQDGFLRTTVMQGNMVVLDVDVDSKDYYTDTPEVVMARTLSRLDARGSGIILFHDIHPRTVALLPGFLAALEERGYSVVRLVPRNPAPFGRDVITAQGPGETGAL